MEYIERLFQLFSFINHLGKPRNQIKKGEEGGIFYQIEYAIEKYYGKKEMIL